MTATLHPAVDAACRAAAHAAPLLAPRSVRARLLRSLAERAHAARAAILDTASRETHLTLPELEPEFDRCAATLRLFADLALDPSWRRPTIDPPAQPPDASIGPNHDLRSLLMPLGPVAVFGASNFPLAYGVLGGDTASALAAACPVLVKEHPAHPETGRLFASLAHAALAELALPAALLAYLPDPDPDTHDLAHALVTHPLIRAVGFTGSSAAGMALDALARSRPDPIPVFAEMGSTNLVVITRDALARRAEPIADKLAASIAARAGQQCTNTGLVILDSPHPLSHPRPRHSPESPADAFIARLVERLASVPPRLMLSPRVRTSCDARLAALRAHPRVRFLLDPSAGATTPPVSRAGLAPVSPAVAFVESSALRTADPVLWDEVFAPVCLCTTLDLSGTSALADLLAVTVPSDPPASPRPSQPLRSPRGVLTASLYIASDSDPVAAHAADTLTRLAGRVIFSGVPTGVRVSASTVHAGPPPATNQPFFSAVGPRAVERWCRPVCFQNCPDALLPEELRDANPLAILRLVRGVPTRHPIDPVTPGCRT